MLDAICGELIELSELHSATTRATLVELINVRLSAPLSPRESGSLVADVYEIVISCSRRSGGMTALLFAVRRLAPGTSAVEHIQLALISHTDELVAVHAEERVRPLLEQVTVARFPQLRARFAHAAAGTALASASAAFDTAWEAFSLFLEASAAPGELPPYVVFVELAARMLKTAERPLAMPSHEDLVTALRSWSDDQVQTLAELDGSDLRSQLLHLRAAPEPDYAHPAYLVFQVQPPDFPVATGSDATPYRYRLSSWRQNDPLHWAPEPEGEPQQVTLAELPARVVERVREAETGWAEHHDGPLILEFLLPFSLLNLGIEWWQMHPPEQFRQAPPTPLGVRYEIMIRSLERHYERGFAKRMWRARWQILATDPQRANVHWIPPGGYPDQHTLQGRFAIDPGLVVLVLSSAPEVGAPGLSDLQIALENGIPAVLWDRTGRHDQQLRTSLHALIQQKDLHQLSRILKGHRAQAHLDETGNELHYRDISLLFDDPSRTLGNVAPLRSPR